MRALAAAGANSRSVVRAAADALRLSTAQVYRLAARFRQHPFTAASAAGEVRPAWRCYAAAPRRSALPRRR